MKTAEYNLLVKQYSNAIFGYAYKMLRNEHEAEDVVQNCFEKLWNQRKQINLNNPKSYLYKMAHNNAIDIIRKRKREVLSNDFPEQVINNAYTDTLKVIEKVANQLPEIQKSILFLRDYEGYDYQSIAEITDLNLSQVKVYLFRARKKMKEKLMKLNLNMVL